MDEWKPVKGFPGYSVSYDGRVRNDRRDRLLVLTRNQQGIIQVGLYKTGEQYKRGVAPLVAHAFLDAPPSPAFNTPIQLDGDRSNCHVDNLMWRPRWFAMKYHKQFNGGPLGFTEPIIELKTKERFETSLEAAMKYGLLDREIMIATLNRTYVWPTYQEFRITQ